MGEGWPVGAQHRQGPEMGVGAQGGGRLGFHPSAMGSDKTWEGEQGGLGGLTLTGGSEALCCLQPTARVSVRTHK